jgi:hypothetical protein|tara:strand:- start:410 stop:577 length:168 start_codon:yes stop_codon:yes gene_type:complete
MFGKQRLLDEKILRSVLEASVMVVAVIGLIIASALLLDYTSEVKEIPMIERITNG